MSSLLETARRYRTEHASQIIDLFSEFLAIPNLDLSGQQLTATWIRDALVNRGASSATVALPGAPPVVTGVIPGAPGGPRIGIYAHYDGQPVDPEKWSSPPFEPALRGEVDDPDSRIYARSTADDKGAIFALLTALDALDGRTPEATIVYLFEGQEEIGSPDLPEYLDTLSDRLGADLWLICDGPVHTSGRPQVIFGARGIADVEITVYGPQRDLHSGHYGNWAPNPAWLLADLVASLRDGFGAVWVEGFGGDSPDDVSLHAAGEVPEPDDLEFAAPDGRYAESVLRPLINVRGLRAGDVGEAARNVVPATATASLDLRLVAGQDPQQAISAIKDHVAGQGFRLVDAEPDAALRKQHRRIARVDAAAGYPGVRTPLDLPAAVRVVEAAADASGEDPVILPSMGGSVPLHHLASRLDVPVIVVPIANADNNQHAPDENLRLGNLWYGIDLFAALLG